MRPALHLALVLLAAPLGAAGAARADVLLVDAGGGGDHADLQSAVDAAQPGDTLLVRSGVYAGCTVDGKSLWVLADAGAEVFVAGTLVVRNVDGRFVAAGLQVRGEPLSRDPQPALRLESNPGHVRFQSCRLIGSRFANAPCSNGLDGGPAAVLVGNAQVVFADCEVLGGTGADTSSQTDYECTGGFGGDAIVSTGSAVTFYDCDVRGGRGGDAGLSGGDGGTALVDQDFGIFASNTRFEGGEGGFGWDFIVTFGGDGGDAVFAGPSGHVHLFDCELVAGAAGEAFGLPVNDGDPGLAQAGTGSFNPLPGAARSFSAPTLAPDGGLVPVAVTGEPGDRVHLAQAGRLGYQFVPSLTGVWLTRFPSLVNVVPLGTLPASGELVVHVPLPLLAPGQEALQRTWQGLVQAADDTWWLGSPMQLGVLGCASLGPDCNANGSADSCDLLRALAEDCDANGVPDSCETDCDGNGVNDVCDLAGGAPDANGNGIPDVCEATGVTWHVDASAAPGGDGSAAAPFRALGEALAVALGMDTVLVADGTYAGPLNRDLDPDGRNIAFRSQNGPAACVIDLEGQGRLFTLDDGENRRFTLEGFTVRNGGGGTAGVLRLFHTSPTIRGCVFEDCAVNGSGGVIAGQASSPLVVDCVFRNNSCGSNGGAADLTGGAPVLVRCLFVGNHADNVGGALRLVTAPGAVHRDCVLLDNSSGNYGGAINIGSSTTLANFLLAGNHSADRGGAIGSSREVHLVNCTVVGNTADVGGGAFFAGFTADWTVRNSIVRGNAAPVGSTGLVDGTDTTMGVDRCDVEGGQASIVAQKGGVLSWGLNLDADPLFVDADGPDDDPLTLEDNDWRLAAGSPCVDVGNNAYLPADLSDQDGDADFGEPLPLDLDGNPRRVDDPAAPDLGAGTPPHVDLGAYERQP